MTCREFERRINEQLDAREAVSPEVEHALEAHRSACPSCQATSARYQRLVQALASRRPAPAPPADFAARFLERVASGAIDAVTDAPEPWPILKLGRALRPFGATAAAVAAAAALLLSVWIGGLAPRPAGPAPPPPGVGTAPPVQRPSRSIDPAALSAALAEATEATWDLARTASAPAARVGMEVLDATELAETTGSLPLPLSEGAATTSEVLQDVGQRVSQGVRPLSGTARHAFGFLLGPDEAPPAGGG
jgi:hypothetical protein